MSDVIRFVRMEYLGQRWARNAAYIIDYACNLEAERLAKIDCILELLAILPPFPEKKKIMAKLVLTRMILKRLGEARWLMESDIITQLAIKASEEEEEGEEEGFEI